MAFISANPPLASSIVSDFFTAARHLPDSFSVSGLGPRTAFFLVAFLAISPRIVYPAIDGGLLSTVI
jgi:hypothetical protein